MAAMRAAVLGGTGSVGKEVIKALVACKECEKVVMINRREIDLKEFASAKVEQRVVDMDKLDQLSDNLRASSVNTIFVTLGVGQPSKLPKATGKEELMRVDCTLPTRFFQSAKAADVGTVALLTAVGSDINSKYSSFTKTGAGGGWYKHVKGQVEANATAAAFKHTGIFQPATLLGSAATPKTFGWVMSKVDWMLPTKYKSIEISDLGQKMVSWAVTAHFHEGGPTNPSLVACGDSLFGIGSKQPEPQPQSS